MKIRSIVALALLMACYSGILLNAQDRVKSVSGKEASPNTIKYKTIKVDDLNIFYREAGSVLKPTILLLHGFPSTSHMYQDLIRDLSADYHLIAPDYPGFGLSSSPPPGEFNYTFDHLATVMRDFIDQIGLKRFSIYMQDYGGPIGFRLAINHPEMISALIIQNANAYNDGLGEGFKKIMKMEDEGDVAGVEKILKYIISLDGIKVQYTDGAKDSLNINPASYLQDYYFMEREGNERIQNGLFQNYHTNLTRYPEWQTYLRTYQPPALIVWGRNDGIFTAPGALAFRKDLKNPEIHLLDGGHFALVEYHSLIAKYIRSFLNAKGIR
jgi:pimeloyl-ACP methyl ester carboxylesterase